MFKQFLNPPPTFSANERGLTAATAAGFSTAHGVSAKERTLKMIKELSASLLYAGTDDRDIGLFEGQYAVPEGMAYNSYVICDEKIAVLDTVDGRKTAEWMENVEQALNGQQPDYLIVQHMEPDHSASIAAFLEKYKGATVVGNTKTFAMLAKYFPNLELKNTLTVKEGEALPIGRRTLRFFMAPMVHWPEVMMTYDETDNVLFSADAFGKFGTFDANEDWACEARRYYFGIVGKYGKQVQSLLKKLSAFSLKMICPLHGPVLTENLEKYVSLYNTWSAYEPEDSGVCICCASVYGHTREAAELLREELQKRGTAVVYFDLTRCDLSEAVEDAFRYDTLVLASTTYNGGVFPCMKTFLSHLTERNYQKRTIALMENGSWAPAANKVMRETLETSGQPLSFAENSVTVNAALNADSIGQIRALAEELAGRSGESGTGRESC